MAVLLVLLLALTVVNGLPVDKKSRSVQLNNDLALALLQTFSSDENSFFSPLALSEALLALLNGAEGDTNKELRHALDIQDSDDVHKVTQGIAKLRDSLSSSELKLATRLLVAKEALKDSEKRSEEIFGLDFKNKHFLNQWIKESTSIERLFRDSTPEGMVVANSARFTGQVKNSRLMAEPKEFHNYISYLMPGLKTKIPFLKIDSKLRSKTSSELKSTLVELPLQSDNLSLIVVLPETHEQIQFLNENMTSAQLESALTDLEAAPKKDLRVLLPKMALEAEFDLREPLEESFELKTLFSAAKMRALKDLVKTQAIHKVVISVSEDDNKEDVSKSESTTPELVVDRPFVLMVREKTSGALVLMGRVQTMVDEELIGLGFI